ncbi:UPF0481 protein At3g47200-like isoform X1 [Castanea sativa]|uniref:UPF0481 protein At3g47200-like isoform X1 n=2 Tax=Castanea sativa TaxID=21020 RepID=UPI003F650A01
MAVGYVLFLEVQIVGGDCGWVWFSWKLRERRKTDSSFLRHQAELCDSKAGTDLLDISKAGMEHVISVEEFHSRKEAGESSRDNDQPVIVAGETHKLTITIQERGSTSSKEKFKKLKEAQAKVQLGTTPKIRKVVMLRDHKHYRKYCEPRVVSLGPIHHGKPAYQLTEEYKLMLADKFIGKTGRTDEELYCIIKDKIKELREYYDEKETQEYSDEDLAWMLFVDGCATLQFIDSIVNDPLEDVKMKNDQVAFVQQDLFLLENQLPYQLLDDLMKNSRKEEKLRMSIKEFINGQSMLDDSDEKIPQENDEEAIHLLDLLRKRLLSVPQESNGNEEVPEEERKWHSFRSVQELREVGIHLKPRKSIHLGEIEFTKKWNFYPGILWMPQITVDDSTGPKFFNLIAYEMCPDFDNDFGITSYIFFLDSLIDEPKDVIELRKAGILHNFLGSDQEVALVFNEMGTDLVPNPVIYKNVKLQIQEYFDLKSMTWISQVLHTHFSSPWTVIAFLAAFFVLVLTVVQTVYSILAYYEV